MIEGLAMRTKLAIGTTLLAITSAAASADQTPAPPAPPAQPAPPSAAAAPRARAGTIVATTGGTYLGIGVQEVDAERAKALKLKDVRGAEVTSVREDSPAAKAGLKDGDVVLEWNGQPVDSGAQLARLVKETPAGRQVKLGVWRNGAMQTVTATMEAAKGISVGSGEYSFVIPEMRLPEMAPMPNIEIPRFQMLYQSPMLGIYGESMSQQEQLADFFGVKEGVLVKSVNKNSAAEKAGLKAGDVIVKVEETKVNSTGDITSALRAARAKKTVTVTVVRNKKEMPLTVTIEATPATAVRAGAAVYRLQPGVRTIRMETPRLRIVRPQMVLPAPPPLRRFV
jgi:serine protease Do